MSLYKKYKPNPLSRFGFSNEWLEYFIPAKNQAVKATESAAIGGAIEHALKQDANGTFGYLLYRNNSTLDNFMSWTRPVDAVSIPVDLKFCTAMQAKNRPISQVSRAAHAAVSIAAYNTHAVGVLYMRAMQPSMERGYSGREHVSQNM